MYILKYDYDECKYKVNVYMIYVCRVLIDLLICSSSFAEADQNLLLNGFGGGGPVTDNASTYIGAGFLVDRVGRFEFPARRSTVSLIGCWLAQFEFPALIGFVSLDA